DQIVTLNITSFINTLEDVNNLKVRFQARDSTCTNGGYTLHDLVELSLNYDLPECYVDEDCDDGNECTSERCENYRCIRTNLPEGTPCEADGLFCTVDHCDGKGKCVYLEPYDCIDVIDCTVDYCDEENDRCVHEPDNSYCDDGLYCNGFEWCNPIGGCEEGTPVDCSAYNIPGIATCTYTPDCNPFTWDFRNPFTSSCIELGNNQGYCTQGDETITHTCADNDLSDTVPYGGCNAPCDENSDCSCPEDQCIGADFYDYPAHGICLLDCTCNTGTGNNEPCEPTISYNDSRCYYCGDGFVNPGEECELPGTSNNEYCEQTTETCEGHKLGTRDAFGDCNSACGCVYDSFTFACVKDKCGAECSSDDDCNQDGWYPISDWNYSHNNCSRCRQEEYRDYRCSEDCMCSYVVIEIREYCEPINEGMVCKVSNYDCKDICTKGQREYVCEQGACVFNQWINLEQCNPYLCDINCGNAFCSKVCSFACGAECEKDENCGDYCQGNLRYYNGDCTENCSCTYQIQDCTLLNGWYETGKTRWVDLNLCYEKEQKEEEYRSYSCVLNGKAECVYEVEEKRWVDTNQTREKEDEIGPEVFNISVNPNPTSCHYKTYGNATLLDCHKIVYAEYFINQEPTCPEPGTGKPMQALDGAFDENVEEVGVEIEKPLHSGVYNFWVRGMDELGNWGDCISYTFVLGNIPPTVYNVRVVGKNVYATIDSNVMVLKIIAAEFFIDTNTPIGGGFPMQALDGAFDESREDVYGVIPEDVWNRLATGEHIVYVHGKDEAGNWGNFGTAKFNKGAPSGGGTGGGGTLSGVSGAISVVSIKEEEFYEQQVPQEEEKPEEEVKPEEKPEVPEEREEVLEQPPTLGITSYFTKPRIFSYSLLLVFVLIAIICLILTLRVSRSEER
ncbi:MAG: hypothetical protein QXS37_04930, partial [Candidatus Aenigmatarchaeota archaeon]